MITRDAIQPLLEQTKEYIFNPGKRQDLINVKGPFSGRDMYLDPAMGAGTMRNVGSRFIKDTASGLMRGSKAGVSFKDTLSDAVSKRIMELKPEAPKGKINLESFGRLEEIKEALSKRALRRDEIMDAIKMLREKGIEVLDDVIPRESMMAAAAQLLDPETSHWQPLGEGTKPVSGIGSFGVTVTDPKTGKVYDAAVQEGQLGSVLQKVGGSIQDRSARVMGSFQQNQSPTQAVSFINSPVGGYLAGDMLGSFNEIPVDKQTNEQGTPQEKGGIFDVRETLRNLAGFGDTQPKGTQGSTQAPQTKGEAPAAPQYFDRLKDEVVHLTSIREEAPDEFKQVEMPKEFIRATSGFNQPEKARVESFVKTAQNTVGEVVEGTGKKNILAYMVAEFARAQAREALGTASSFTLDPAFLAVTGEPTPEVDVSGVGKVQTIGRRAVEYAKKDGDVAGGIRALSEGLLGSAGLLAIGQLATIAGKQIGGVSPNLVSTARSVKGKNLASGMEGAVRAGDMPREALFSHDNILVPEAAKGRIADAAQKLDNFVPGLGDAVRKLDPTTIELVGNTYPQISKVATQAIHRYLQLIAVSSVAPGIVQQIMGEPKL